MDNKDKQTLDAIGKALIERDVLSSDEVDRLVSNPHLFAKIRLRKADTVAIVSPRYVRYSTAFAAVALLVIAIAASLSLFRPKEEIASVKEVKAPAEMPATAARPDNLPPHLVGRDPSPRRAAFRTTSAARTAYKAAVYSAPAKRRPQIGQQAEAPEFYPVAYTGDPSEISSGSHIVRVDVARASLFALGVNVPIENVSETVKADLLVGPDGVTRAIRVLK